MKALARILLVLVPAFVLAIGAAAWWNLRPARVRPRVAGLELQDLGGESLKRWDPTKESPPAPKPILPRRPSVAVGAHDPARPGQPTFLLRRSNVLRKKGESYAYNSESYGATFADGGIDFGLPVQRRPLLSYSFEELRSGREVLARGGAVKPRARADQSEVYFDRGTVEEVYTIRPEGLEQSFVVRSLPDTREDLTVVGSLRTNLFPPKSRTPESRLTFTDGFSDQIAISHAVARDAAGKELALAMTYQPGKLSMTVPKEWVGAAELPIVIDPLIGSAITLRDPSNIQPRIYLGSAVAFGAAQNSYLVVWYEQIGANFDETDVLGQRVSGDGTLLGGPITIGGIPSADTLPAVSYAPSEDRFLVTWYQNAGPPRIAGRILNGDGTFFTDTFTASADPGTPASIAFDGTNWFVVMGQSAGSTGYYLRGRFIGVDGTPGATVDIDVDNNSSAYGSVAFTNGTYMVTWTKMIPQSPLFGRTLDTSGALLTPRTSLWSDPVNTVSEDQSVSAGGGRFLATWIHSGIAKLQGQIFDASLNSLAGPFILETQSWPVGPRGTYAATNSEWVVAYVTGFPPESYEVYIRRVSATGGLAPRERLTTNAIPDWAPCIAWNSLDNEALVTFFQGELGSPLAVVGQRVDLDTLPPQAPPSLAATPGNNSVSLSWNASNGATSYTVKRGTTSGGPYPVTFTGIAGTTHLDSSAVNGTTYFYVVTALNAFGESGPSNEVAVTPVPPPPAAPSALVATPENGAVQLSWNATGGATSYTVRRSTTNGGPYTNLVSGLTTPSYHDSGLTNDTTYYYVVAAGNLGGVGPNSNQAQATPRAASAQILLVTLGSTLGAGDSAIDARIRALGYTTVIREAGASKSSDALGKAAVVISSTIGSGSVNTKFRDVAVPVVNWENALHDDLGMTGLVGGTDYGTTGGQTSVAIVDAVHPLAAGLSGTVAVSSSSIYSWGVPNANAAKVATLAGNAGRSVIFSYEAGASMPGLAAPARRVGFFLEDLTASAWNAQGQALFDAAIGWATGGSGAGAPPPPSGLTATGGDGQVALSWNATSGSPTYTVKRGTVPGGPYATVATGVGQTTYTDPGLTNGVAYFYVVSAQEGAASSGLSNEAFATPTAFPVHALLVVGNATLGAGDAAVKSRLEGLGFTVTVKDGPSSATADAAGKALILISSTISSGSVTTKFRVSPVPVLTWENALFDDFGMTGVAAGTHYGTLAAQTRLSIPVTAHPLAAGLSGSVLVSTSSGPFTWGVPNGAATQIASLESDPTRSALFAYEVGASMPGLVAPARRVGFFLEDLTASSLTANGWALFDAAVRWAASTTPGAPPAPTGLVATAGAGQVSLSWSASPGAGTYTVKRAPVTGGPYTALQTGLPGTTFEDTAVSPDTSYYYVVTALAGAAESGPSNEAVATLVSSARTALFVVGSATLGAGDAAAKARLEGLGFTVTVKDGPSSATSDAAGKSLVVVSSTIGSATVNTKFRTVAVPVINWENALYDDFGMTGLVQASDYGTTASQTTVLTIDSAHPLAAGLSGTVAVTTQAQTMSWGVPNANAAQVASLTGTPGRLVVFGYEAGAAMPGLLAPARRVGFFLEDLTAQALGVNGWKLFDAAVRWAIDAGAPVLPPPPAILSPVQNEAVPTLTPNVSGTSAAAGLEIALFANGFQVGTTTSGAGGAWSILPTPLPDGIQVLTATVSNGTATSNPSAAVTIFVDTVAPTITILTPANGSSVGDPRPIIIANLSDPNGSGIDPSSILFTLDGQPETPTLAQINPTTIELSFQPPSDLANGAHHIGIDARDRAFHPAIHAGSVFTVVTLAVSGGSLPDGAYVGDAPVTYSATLTNSGGSGIIPGSIVVYVDGNPVGATVTVIDANTVGISFTTPSNPGAGTHQVTVQWQTAQGDTFTSPLVSFSVDSEVPVVSQVVPSEGQYLATSQPLISGLVSDTGGSGLDGSSLVLQVDQFVVGASIDMIDPNQATVSYTPSLPDGPHFGLFTGADLAGNQVSAYSVNFFIDTAPPTVSVTAPLSAPDYTSTSVPVDLLVSDPGSGVQSANVQVYLNGVPAGPEVSVSPLDASNVSVTGTLSALVGSNTLSVIGFDNAGNPFNFTASFTVAGSTVPPSFFVPRPVVDIEAITEPPFPDEQPGLFFPTQGRPIYFQVRTKADGTDQEGVIIDPVITSGAGQVFYTPSYPQTSDSSGVAGFGFIPARAGNASITVKSIVGEPGQTTQFNMIVGAIAPVITLLATVEPGSSLVAPVYGGIASRMTVYVDEVDEDHEPIMDPSQRKLTFFNQVYTTEPDGTAYVPIRINSGAWTGQGSAAYMRATFPEFRDEDGNVMKAFTSFSVLNPAISIPTTSISGGNGQTFYPGRPLDQPIVIEAIVPEGQEHTIIQASVFGPGTIQNVSGGRLLTWTPDHKTVVVERPGSGGSLSVQYTADPGQTRAATILTRSIGTFVDPPDGVIMTGSPLAEHAVVLAPQIEYLTGDSELVSISMADVDEILETPIQSERYTRLEARVPFSGVGSSTLEVTLQALGPDGNPLSDDQLFPPVQQTLTLTRVGGSDKFVSGPFVASTERKKIDATPSLPFQAVRLGSFMRAMPVVAALQGVPQQAAPIMSPVLDPPIPARAGPPNDFVELVNGRVNGMDGPGSEGLFLNIDLRPVVPPGAPGPVTIQGQQLQGAVPLQLGDLFVADQGPERTFNRAVTEVARGIHYIFDNPTVNHQQTDLVFTMLGAGLANGNDRVRVPVRLSRYAGTVRITYRYVLSAGEGGVPPFRRLRLDEQHYITNMIWRQAGVRVLNSAVAGVGYRVVPNQPLRITDYDGSQQSVTDFNNMNLQDQTNVTVFYIDNITTHPTAGGLTAVYPANAVKRWCVVTKNAFTFPTVNSGHTAHELGHILGLDDTVVPAGAGVLNLNLMMNQPGQRVMNMLFDINVNTQRTGNENQMTITRAVAGVLNQE